METITASTDVLMRQAPMTVEVYLYDAVKTINKQFDDETYAARHPDLVGAFIQACAVDMQTSTLGGILQDAAEALADGMAMRNDPD